MEIPPLGSIPPPAFVDDWVDEQCRTRGMSFDDLALEAISFLHELLGEGCASQTPAGADLDTWVEAEAAVYGAGLEDRVTEALCAVR